MTYKHLSQEERYQIYILMSAGNSQQQIAELLGRHKSTISGKVARNSGGRDYRPRQACLLAEERSLGSRDAGRIGAKQWSETVDYLHEKWSPEQIANEVGISHETIYRHVYADKAADGSLWEALRCQKKRRSGTLAVKIAEVRSLVEGQLVNVLHILKGEHRLVIGKVIQ